MKKFCVKKAFFVLIADCQEFYADFTTQVIESEMCAGEAGHDHCYVRNRFKIPFVILFLNMCYYRETLVDLWFAATSSVVLSLGPMSALLKAFLALTPKYLISLTGLRRKWKNNQWMGFIKKIGLLQYHSLLWAQPNFDLHFALGHALERLFRWPTCF